MTCSRPASRLPLVALLTLLAASDALAVRRTEDPLALVPSGAATIGVIHWNELRSSPLGARVFADMDAISSDGDAARFLRETGLSPRDDVDTVVIAMSPGSSPGSDDGLVVFEGRFDVDRIAGALASRGATRRAGAGGGYFRLASHGSASEGAVALVNRHLVIAGSESAVIAALARRENGGSGGLTSGEGLGRQLSRIDPDASAWALIDLTRFPPSHRGESEGSGSGEPARALFGAMKSVSLVALQASVHGDAVDLSATGLTADAGNRDLLEDSLRGILAMWRLAVSEKSPELVSVLRRFRIENDGEGVSISGTLPGSFLRSLSDKRAEKR
ncbi:MAG TPA: hypothetical protein VGL03_01555 [Thermoanaerobaculia bacterium]